MTFTVILFGSVAQYFDPGQHRRFSRSGIVPFRSSCSDLNQLSAADAAEISGRIAVNYEKNMMHRSTISPNAVVAIVLLVLLQLAFAAPLSAEPDDPKLANKRCLMCHGRDGFSREGADGQPRDLHVDAERFAESVHGARDCVGCHTDIIKVPHRKGVQRGVGCVQCHLNEWEKVQTGENGAESEKLANVVEHIETYMKSMHARPRLDDQSRTNATCHDCHGGHYVKPVDREARSANFMEMPQVCGKCHADELEAYKESVHGKEVAAGNLKAAVCSDCHSRHGVGPASGESARLEITENCGNCHEAQFETYAATYHGKVTQLGYGQTAKCYDCHGSHQILRLDNPDSKMHAGNRLENCRTCHEGAQAGFITFYPHGTASDRDKYPEMWFAQTFMIGLLLGTFAFFWLHSALWFYREWKDRKEGKNRPHVNIAALGLPEGKTHFRRFSRWWRLAHLVGALSIMTLTLTGVAVLFADSSWAPSLMRTLGGPETAGYIHRVGAIGFISVFFIHLVYFAIRIGRNWRDFDWFGPNSLVPSLTDLQDAVAMFRWFFGLAPRPQLDRFTYWEKFDYWAPFWGMTIIGLSGLVMWFPGPASSFLPGWAFNVAQIVHGEEAFLAAVFLFTVHFFNNHFRPDKFPQDTTMFTGRVPLEIYMHEHRREYERLKASGELDKYLVSAPTEQQAKSASLLGASLITFGLFLLTLVITGFLGL
jgi:cytochrome b subunit of formate dehydrogenase